MEEQKEEEKEVYEKINLCVDSDLWKFVIHNQPEYFINENQKNIKLNDLGGGILFDEHKTGLDQQVVANSEIVDNEVVEDKCTNEVKGPWSHSESADIFHKSYVAGYNGFDASAYTKKYIEEIEADLDKRMKEKSELILKTFKNTDYSYKPRRAGKNTISSLTGHYSEESSDYCKPPEYYSRAIQEQEDEQYRFLRGINKMKLEDI